MNLALKSKESLHSLAGWESTVIKRSVELVLDLEAGIQGIGTYLPRKVFSLASVNIELIALREEVAELFLRNLLLISQAFHYKF